jgi:hypothetical protein
MKVIFCKDLKCFFYLRIKLILHDIIHNGLRRSLVQYYAT